MKLDHCHLGDCRDSMRLMLDAGGGGKVQTIVTSPPYWNLRDYGVAGQLGMEPTLREYVATMVEVFDLARQVLADDGTLWLNLGDSYASRGGPAQVQGGEQFINRQRGKSLICHSNRLAADEAGLKPKDLCGIPWRVAFALQDAGWYLRQDIIWNKPNPMPESVRDRCTKSHEYLFLLTKSERYFFDFEAFQEPVTGGAHARAPGNRSHKGEQAYLEGDEHHRTKAGLVAYAERKRQKTPDGWDTTKGNGGHGSFHKDGREKGKARDAGVGPKARPAKSAPNEPRVKYNESFSAAVVGLVDKRNRRSVWTIPTESYSEAHFATFPRALVEPCILAGSRPGDIVFDPFLGSGTVAQVAQNLGRRWVGCELNEVYVKLQDDRTRQSGLVLEVAA